MRVMGYDVVLDIDGVESTIQLDDTYPAIKDWQTATTFAFNLAEAMHPDADNINFVECGEFEMEEYAEYEYIFETPCVLQ